MSPHTVTARKTITTEKQFRHFRGLDIDFDKNVAGQQRDRRGTFRFIHEVNRQLAVELYCQKAISADRPKTDSAQK